MEAKKKQEDLLKKMELQKKAKNIIVPTSEADVKAQLRELKQPITYFGETAADRRERYLEFSNLYFAMYFANNDLFPLSSYF